MVGVVSFPATTASCLTSQRCLPPTPNAQPRRAKTALPVLFKRSMRYTELGPGPKLKIISKVEAHMPYGTKSCNSVHYCI